MAQTDEWKMTPLDSMLCSNQLQIMKSLVFFLPPAHRKQMVFLVKLMELRQCLSLSPGALGASTFGNGQFPDMFERIWPYCDRERQQSFHQMQNTFRMMRTVRQFSDAGMMNGFGDIFGDFSGRNGNSDTDIFDADEGASPMDDAKVSTPVSSVRADNSDQLTSMLSSMMNPEQQALFRQYESMLGAMEIERDET